MKEPGGTKVCPLCKRPKRPSAYPIMPNGERGGVCSACCARTSRSVKSRRWTWQQAILKTIRQGRQAGRFRYVDEDLLTALMEVQGFRCAASGRELEIPDTPDMFGVSWKTMQKYAEFPQQTPELVRNDKSRAWEPGNLAFICHDLLALYESLPSLHSMLYVARKITEHGVCVPGRKEIELHEPENKENDGNQNTTHRGSAAGVRPVRDS